MSGSIIAPIWLRCELSFRPGLESGDDVFDSSLPFRKLQCKLKGPRNTPQSHQTRVQTQPAPPPGSLQGGGLKGGP